MATSFWGQSRPGWGWGLGGILMILGSNHASILTGSLAHGAIFGVKVNIALGSILSVLHVALIQGVGFQTLAKVRYVGGHFVVWSGQLQLAGVGLLGSWVYLPIVNYYNLATFLTGIHAHGTMIGVRGYFALGSILSSVQHLVDSAGPLGLHDIGTRRVRRSPPAAEQEMLELYPHEIDVSVSHVPVIQHLNTEVNAGSIVSVFGASGSGKGQLLKILTGHVKPWTGNVLYPTLHIVLQVGYIPEVVSYLNLLQYLRFGSPPDVEHPDRVRNIFQNVTHLSDKHWLMKQLDSEFADGKAPEDWWRCLSHVVQKMIHFSRALAFSPHILVLHKLLDDLEVDVAVHIPGTLCDFVKKGHRDKKRRTVFISAGTLRARTIITQYATHDWDLTQRDAQGSIAAGLRSAKCSLWL